MIEIMIQIKTIKYVWIKIFCKSKKKVLYLQKNRKIKQKCVFLFCVFDVEKKKNYTIVSENTDNHIISQI